MKYAFLGKGGSGKTTTATAFVNELLSSGKRVLAIDADHNMDLAFNLGIDPHVFIGTDPHAIKRHVGFADLSYADAAIAALSGTQRFRLSPADDYTRQHTHVIHERLSVMVAGPHTDTVRSGDSCSHSLAAPLKVYLPLLELAGDEAVVIDERAGTDPVATGILKGVDMAYIVAEPTIHSLRVARQIAHELEQQGILYEFIANKYHDGADLSSLPRLPIRFIRSMFAASPPSIAAS